MTDHVELLMEPQPANQLHSAAGYLSDTGLSFLIDHRVLLSCYVNHLKEEGKKETRRYWSKTGYGGVAFSNTHQCALCIVQCVSVSVCGGSD